MTLLIQPDDGLKPLLEAIENATRSIEIVIFRFDRRDLEAALAAAVGRGVAVQALIAHTNHAGEDLLRKLELRLLAAGVTVARTAGDFARYHSKMMIVDRKELFVLGFNYTGLDIERSRSFGVATRNRKMLQEAVKLFEADCKRQPYNGGLNGFVVSPFNARPQLAAFIKGAKLELLIYDVAVSDPAMLALLALRAKAGVKIRVIGEAKSTALEVRAPSRRLHARTIIRDRSMAFNGSQSLRQAELENRREVGIIFKDASAVSRLCEIFEEDWNLAGAASTAVEVVSEAPGGAGKVAKKAAKAVLESMPPLATMIEEMGKEMGKEMASEDYRIELDGKEIEANVAEAVKTAVKIVVKQAVKEAMAENENSV